jgi:hypothetical protein
LKEIGAVFGRGDIAILYRIKQFGTTFEKGDPMPGMG